MVQEGLQCIISLKSEQSTKATIVFGTIVGNGGLTFKSKDKIQPFPTALCSCGGSPSSNVVIRKQSSFCSGGGFPSSS